MFGARGQLLRSFTKIGGDGLCDLDDQNPGPKNAD